MMQNIAQALGSALLICVGLLWATGDSFAQKEKHVRVLQAKDLSYYEVIGRRDLFKLPVKEIKTKPVPEEQKEMKERADGKQVQELKGLVITGIVSIGDQYKVILEERGKSYYLGVGDEIKGAEILDIGSDKVILGYRGKEVELVFEREPKGTVPKYERPTFPWEEPPSGRRPTRLRRSRGSRVRRGRTRQPSIPPIPPE